MFKKIKNFLGDKKNLDKKPKQKVLTKEELHDQLKFYLKKQDIKSPFTTRDHAYFSFYDEFNNPEKVNVPFEKVPFEGKTYYIHKKFEGVDMQIEHIFPEPEMTFNIMDERKKLKQHQKEARKIEIFLSHIHAKGNPDKVNVKDYELELFNLRKIIDGCKYGETMAWTIDLTNEGKPTFIMQRVNRGMYIYKRFTRSGYVVDEHTSRMAIAYEASQRMKENTNMKNKKILAGIIILAIIVVYMLLNAWIIGGLALAPADQALQMAQEICGGEINATG